MPELTFYPDAHPEDTSVDGQVGAVDMAGLSWADLRALPGNSINDDNDRVQAFRIQSASSSNTWAILVRGIYLFDTSEIPSGVSILSATFSVCGQENSDGLLISTALNVYGSSPIANNALAQEDYQNIASVPFCDTPIIYLEFLVHPSIVRRNYFVLNSDGLNAIQPAGITKLALRESNYDVPNTPPPWTDTQVTRIYTHSVEKGGLFRPELVVTYRSAFPTHALSRTTGIICRRSPGIDSMELLMGGLAPDPVTRFSFTPETAVPQAPPPLGAALPEATGLIGPFVDPVSGQRYWIDIHGTIIWEFQRPPTTFEEFPEDFVPPPPTQWPGLQ